MIRGQVKHLVDPAAQMARLRSATKRRIVTKAARNGGKVLLTALKAAAPRRSGALAVAMGQKVTKRPNGATAVVGPKKDYSRSMGGRTVRPVKYAHLVEKGRRAIKVLKKRVLSSGDQVFGRKARAVSPTNFTKRVFASKKDEAVETMRRVTAEEITVELAKGK